MPDNVSTKDTNVHTDEITTHNGVATAVDTRGRLPQSQINKPAFGPDGETTTVDDVDGFRFPVSDPNVQSALQGLATALIQSVGVQSTLALLVGGVPQDVAPAVPVPMADYTGGYSLILQDGLTVAAGAEVQLVAASPIDPVTGIASRVRIRINHRGDPTVAVGDPLQVDTSGAVFVGWGVTASGGVLGQEQGDYIERDGQLDEFYSGAVRVRNVGPVPVRLTWTEWTA